MEKTKKQLLFILFLCLAIFCLLLPPTFSDSTKKLKKGNTSIRSSQRHLKYLVEPNSTGIFYKQKINNNSIPLFVKSQIDSYLAVLKRLNRSKKARFVPGEVVVKFNEGLSAKEVQDFAANMGGKLKKKSQYADFEVIRLPDGTKVMDVVRRLSRQPEVIYAEPNYIRYAHFTPNDTYYSYQWHLQKINLEEAWEMNFGSDPSVVVAIIDTGVAYENYREFRMATDLAGTRFVNGYDFVNNDNHPNDEGDGLFGHGTFVAGVIAQTTNNAFGVAGIAFNASIMPLRILDRNGWGTTADLAEAIIFATLNGASVINMSLGGPDPSQAEQEAVKFAYRSGVAMVASAGNSRDEPNPPEDVDYPARYEEVISVGATDYNNNFSYYSNSGKGLDIVAPGGDTTADLNNDNYGDGILQQSFLVPDYGDFNFYFAQGTSFSAPHISGVAALLISQYGISDPGVIYDALRYTAVDLGPKGKDNDNGHGLVSARNILLALGIDN